MSANLDLGSRKKTECQNIYFQLFLHILSIFNVRGLFFCYVCFDTLYLWGWVPALSIYFISRLRCRPHVLFQFFLPAISFFFLPNSSFDFEFPLVRCAKLITFFSSDAVLWFLFALLIQASHIFL